MLGIFSQIYNGEISYSIFARYSVLNGNTSYVQTAIDLFGIENSSYNIFYPTYLNDFVNRLKAHDINLTSNDIIRENTIFSLFKPFMSETRAEQVKQKMCHGISYNLNVLMGINSGDIFLNGQIIKVCPLCFKEDVSKYGEAYIHRLHQMPGNLICEKHGLYLNEYPIPTNRNMLFDINDIDVEALDISKIGEDLMCFYLNLSQDIKYVMNGGYEKYDNSKIQLIYKNKLREKGYFINTNINNRKLINDFTNFYPSEFLRKLESDVDNNKSCWLVNIVSSKYKYIHPIRHLLFVRFLFGSADSLEHVNSVYTPFGEGPWPCLNPAADHYKDLLIHSCNVKSNGKIKGLIGYFKCSCGFEYTRKGPDKSENDKYRYTSVSHRGEIWKNKLRDLIINTDQSVTKLEKEMKCSKHILIKYAVKMGISDKLDITTKYKPHPAKMVDLNLYKEELIEFIKDNPDANRTKIKSNLTKQYVALQRNENDWLETVLPKPINGWKSIRRSNDEDKEELDNELCNLINEAIVEILNDEKGQRITIKQIAKKINYYGIQKKKNLLKLPNTKKVLDLKCETNRDKVI